MAVPCHDARGEFTSTVLPLSRGFLFARARAHLVPVQSQVRLGHSHGGPQAGPGATTTKCDVRTNLVLFPSAQELSAQDQLKLLVLTPRCPKRARIIHAERGRDRGLC